MAVEGDRYKEQDKDKIREMPLVPPDPRDVLSMKINRNQCWCGNHDGMPQNQQETAENRTSVRISNKRWL